MYKYILFDLDGTIAKSDPGVTNCVRYALEKTGFGVKDGDDLLEFIGPPLTVSFKEYYGMNDEQAAAALAFYRERYNPIGIFECDVYKGIPELADELRRAGRIVTTATSKPQHMAERVIESFGMTDILHAVIGSDISNEYYTKADVIRDVFARFGIPESERHTVVMVGDRKYDVEGAHECGIDCIGVGYGYGTEAELREAGCEYYAETVEDLRKLLLEN